MELQDSKDIYVVIINSDLTEGSGHNVHIAWCLSEATAIRLGKGKNTQGIDAEIKKVPAFLMDGLWYGPVNLEHPNRFDRNEEKRLERRRKAVAKMEKVGLTLEEIKEILNDS